MCAKGFVKLFEKLIILITVSKLMLWVYTLILQVDDTILHTPNSVYILKKYFINYQIHFFLHNNIVG